MMSIYVYPFMDEEIHILIEPNRLMYVHDSTPVVFHIRYWDCSRKASANRQMNIFP